jgi:hypothetical protein
VVLNLSGRGDKDVNTVADRLGWSSSDIRQCPTESSGGLPYLLSPICRKGVSGVAMIALPWG